MNIVILCDMDFSGNMYNLATFVNKYTKHFAVSIKLRVNRQMRYPTMLHATEDNMDKVRRMVYNADVVVFKEVPYLPKKLGLDLTRLADKKIVMLMGGGGWRRKSDRWKNFKTYGNITSDVKFAVSSLDFLREKNNVGWIPASIRFHDVIKYASEKARPPLFATSPSKSTDKEYNVREQFRWIVGRLLDQNLSFQAKEIFGISNHECLMEKAKASIFYDRILDIYGMNSQEAAALGCAVITGLSDFVLNKLSEFGYDCPFLIINDKVGGLRATKKLLEDADFREKKATQCYDYVKDLHSGEVSARRLVELIEC